MESLFEKQDNLRDKLIEYNREGIFPTSFDPYFEWKEHRCGIHALKRHEIFQINLELSALMEDSYETRPDLYETLCHMENDIVNLLQVLH